MPGPKTHLVSNSGARAERIYRVRGLDVWSSGLGAAARWKQSRFQMGGVGEAVGGGFDSIIVPHFFSV